MNYRYQIKPFQTGGEKSVHLGTCVESGLDVVLKFPLLPYTAAGRAGFVVEVRRTLRVQALGGESVTAVLDYNLAVEPPFFVEAYYPDGTLAKLIADLAGRKQVFRDDFALNFARQILVALSNVHESGQIHRDVKPSNVFYTRSDHKLVLGDFGIGRTLNRPTVVQTRAFKGTRGYASPEQELGGRLGGVDHRTDLYAVGVILHEMLTGKRGGWDAITYRGQPAISAILDGLLAFDRDDRYRSANSAIRAIDGTRLAHR